MTIEAIEITKKTAGFLSVDENSLKEINCSLVVSKSRNVRNATNLTN
jgi:hypothetical protein